MFCRGKRRHQRWASYTHIFQGRNGFQAPSRNRPGFSTLDGWKGKLLIILDQKWQKSQEFSAWISAHSTYSHKDQEEMGLSSWREVEKGSVRRRWMGMRTKGLSQAYPHPGKSGASVHTAFKRAPRFLIGHRWLPGRISSKKIVHYCKRFL